MTKCEQCNKTFRDNSTLQRHLNKKIKCVGEVINHKHYCNNCNKNFSSYRTLYNHTKNNICKKNIQGDTINNQNNTLNQLTQQNIDKQLNVDNVKLVKFGNENLSYISDDIFKSILGRGFKAVEELVDHSHFHPDHPENYNIYIANIKNDYVVIYDGKKWNINKKEDVFEDIIYAKSDFLCMKFKELMGQMTETAIRKFTNFINERDEDKTMNKIKGELKLQLYNNRYLPEKLRKHMEATERILLKDLNKKPNKTKKSNTSSIENIMNMLDNMDESKVKDVEALLNRLDNN